MNAEKVRLKARRLLARAPNSAARFATALFPLCKVDSVFIAPQTANKHVRVLVRLSRRHSSVLPPSSRVARSTNGGARNEAACGRFLPFLGALWQQE